MAQADGKRAPKDPRVLIILPALNEAATIGKVISEIPKEIAEVKNIELLVMDDGSSDDTAEIARKAGADVISHSRNLGLGIAIQSGLQEALRRGVDYAVNMDADGQFNPNDIEKLLRPLLDGEANFVTASRFKDPDLIPEMPKVKRFGNNAMSWIVSQIVGHRFMDVSCGFRAYSREALMRLVLFGKFTYTQETFLELGLRGMRMLEVPVKVRGVREFGKSRIASNLFRYAFRTLGIIFASVRDYRPGIFFNTSAQILFLLSTVIGIFFFWHYFTTGAFSPHLWAGFLSAFLMGLSILIFFIGQLALMMGRVRQLEHEQLYLIRSMLNEND